MTLKSSFKPWTCLLSAILWAAPGAQAAESVIPSCYASLHIALPPQGDGTELFMMVDQTVVFDASLQRNIADVVANFIRPGNAIHVVQFSAFNQGRYTVISVSGALERFLPLRRRNDTGAQTLAKLDKCLGLQQAFGRKVVAHALFAAMAGASTSLSRSDIVASLHDVSRLVRASPLHDRVVLLASDMLENSAVSSFYRAAGVRRIAPDAELKKVEQLGLFGDFGGARVYVIGAGSLPAQDGHASGAMPGDHAYRDPITIAALSRFWQGYFRNSNARLEEFGTPALLGPVR